MFALFLSLSMPLSFWVEVARKEAEVEGFISEATQPFLLVLHASSMD